MCLSKVPFFRYSASVCTTAGAQMCVGSPYSQNLVFCMWFHVRLLRRGKYECCVSWNNEVLQESTEKVWYNYARTSMGPLVWRSLVSLFAGHDCIYKIPPAFSLYTKMDISLYLYLPCGNALSPFMLLIVPSTRDNTQALLCEESTAYMSRNCMDSPYLMIPASWKEQVSHAPRTCMHHPDDFKKHSIVTHLGRRPLFS